MNINYQFSDMIGSSYRNGNVSFLGNNIVVSPVGNKIKIFNIKENNSWTLPLQSSYNITILELSPSGEHAFAVNEVGIGMFISILYGTVLYRMRFGNKVNVVKFSPDGKKLAVCTGGKLSIYKTNFTINGLFNPFALVQIRQLSSEPLKVLNWSHDSKLIVCGGDDKRLWIVDPCKRFSNLTAYGISSHREKIVGCFFVDSETYDIISIDQKGVAYHWECNMQPGELNIKTNDVEIDKETEKINYNFTKRELFHKHLEGKIYEFVVTSACFNKKLKILIIGYAHGVFMIVEIPTFSVIQNMRASDFKISTLSINESGDWLAIGCGEGSQSQLVVWEWQSESYVLKQQSHSQTVLTAAFSPDGSLLATGAEDGKIKIWNTLSSFCVVTFTDHTSGVSAICWTQSGKAIVSAALDGTIRCHDIKRYRNFRTMTCPKPTQLGSLVVDDSSELIIASSRELFEVYIFSMDTGDMIDNFSGHSSVISKLAIHGSNLATISLDKTMRIFNIVDQTQSESLKLVSEGLDVKFSACGKMIAALTYDSQITLFDAKDRHEIGVINTKLDVDASRLSKDEVKKSTSEKNKSFTCICFSPDSTLILAAGQSNFFCLYNVENRMLIKKFFITLNKSLDGVRLDIDYKKITEFGNMELFESSDEENDHIPGTLKRKTKLAGTTRSDMSERLYKPIMRVNAVDFNPTSRSFAVVSTEGIALYSLDNKRRFDPFELTVDVTPKAVNDALSVTNYVKAISLALKLNNIELIKKVLLQIHWKSAKYVVSNLNIVYVEKLLKIFGDEYASLFNKNFHLFHHWINAIFVVHGHTLKSLTGSTRQKLIGSLTTLQHIITTQNQQVFNPMSEAVQTMEYFLTCRKLKKSELNIESEPESEESEMSVIEVDSD